MGIVTGYLSQLVNSGIKLLVGGTAVSSSNPLPVQNANASPIDRSSTITTGGAAQDGSATSIFVTGDGDSGTDQSMQVRNYPFVYPRSFVGTWIIKYQ